MSLFATLVSLLIITCVVYFFVQREEGKEGGKQEEKSGKPYVKSGRKEEDDSEPKDGPASAPIPPLSSMSVERVSSLSPLLPYPPDEDPLDAALREQRMLRNREPNMKTYYTESRDAHQRAVAIELTTRDPNVRPIGGSVGCKVSLGKL